MSFVNLLEKLKTAQQEQASVLAKSAAAAYPLSKQSLDTALKSCASMGYGDHTQKLLKDMHAAGCAAGVPDEELESHIATSMRTLATKKPMTKSMTPGEALTGQLETGEPAPVFNPTIINADPGMEAIHRAHAQQLSDARFIEEITQSGAVAAGDIVGLSNALARTRGLPDEVRAAGITAVRQQVASAGPDLSPAVKGIDWGDSW